MFIVTRMVALATTLLLVAGWTAAFAASPKAGGLYQGTESGCTTAPTGYTCVFLFRVSPNGGSMSFVAKHNVIGAWACNGGGGEAILGPYKKPLQGQPVPSVTINAHGTFTGSRLLAPEKLTDRWSRRVTSQEPERPRRSCSR